MRLEEFEESSESAALRGSLGEVKGLQFEIGLQLPLGKLK